MKHFFAIICVSLGLNLAYTQTTQILGSRIYRLKKKANFKRIVVLNNEFATFYFDYDDYIDFYNKPKNREGFGPDFLSKMNLTIAQVEKYIKDDTLEIDSLVDRFRLSGSITNYLIYGIESRRILVFRKNISIPESRIRRERFEINCMPRCSRAGRKYYLDGTNKLLLQCIDWIS